jgi:hypothetical protein
MLLNNREQSRRKQLGFCLSSEVSQVTETGKDPWWGSKHMSLWERILMDLLRDFTLGENGVEELLFLMASIIQLEGQEKWKVKKCFDNL